LVAKSLEFGNGPKLFWVTGYPPRVILGSGWLAVARIGRALVEIVHEVNYNMGTACLPREIIVIARQHVPV